MALRLVGSYCGSGSSYGLTLTCMGVHCVPFTKYPIVSCEVSDNVHYCTNSVSCSGSNYTSSYHIYQHDTYAVIETSVSVVGKTFSNTLNVPFTLNKTALATRRNVYNEDLNTRASGGKFYQFIAKSLTDVPTAAQAALNGLADGVADLEKDGWTESSSAYAEQLSTDFLKAILPAADNIAIDFAKGDYEEGFKDISKTLLESAADSALGLEAPETFGASLLASKLISFFTFTQLTDFHSDRDPCASRLSGGWSLLRR